MLLFDMRHFEKAAFPKDASPISVRPDPVCPATPRARQGCSRISACADDGRPAALHAPRGLSTAAFPPGVSRWCQRFKQIGIPSLRPAVMKKGTNKHRQCRKERRFSHLPCLLTRSPLQSGFLGSRQSKSAPDPHEMSRPDINQGPTEDKLQKQDHYMEVP